MKKEINLEMEEIDCPFCGGPEKVLLHREDPFQMVKCSSCRSIYLNPRPTRQSLFHFYQHYLPENDSSIEAWQSMMKSIFKRAAILVQRYKEKGKLLDVGSGFGFFLSEMKQRGWEVEGVEVSQKAIDYARNVLSVPVHSGPLETIGFPENFFDAVSAFYVIEHLPHPMAFLKECHRILKPGGIFLARYPHTTPIKNLLRFLGIENRLYDLPAHLSDFSPASIQQCLEQAGLERCQHLIGGYTLPDTPGKRVASFLFGTLAEAFFFLSGKKFLFPGVSKMVLAFKTE